MATVRMREIREGEIPFAAGTAVQDDPERPAFRGNGPDDYVCVKCGNVLAESMHALQMSKKVRVRCGRCSTVNVARYEESEAGGGGPR
jgi:phage FluMu protein Com